ncbi:MAG: polymerase sigma-70 factor, subfamily, partial [Actinomycetota bacterium]|nr:polymerase sigma-70 factor, subfamily [Actinomycetota bacterium]
MILVEDEVELIDAPGSWTMPFPARAGGSAAAVSRGGPTVTVDLKAMSTMDPAFSAMHEGAGNDAKPPKTPAASPVEAPAPSRALVPAHEAAGQETSVNGQPLDVATETTEERRLRFERDA